MLPERKRDLAGSEGGRGGFEVRVIGGSAPAAVELTEQNRSGVEVGVVIGTSNPRGRRQLLPEDGPVLRLEVEDQGDQVKARSMSEVGPAVPREGSRKKKRDRLHQVTLWMAGGVCGIAIVAVGALLARRGADSPKPQVASQAPAAPVDTATLERDRFVSDSAQLLAESENLIRRFAAAKTPEEGLPLLRDAERVKPVFLRQWKTWSAEPAFADGQTFEWEVDTSGVRPMIVISGMKGDFTPFRATFVRQGDKMLLDWEATTGAGDLSVSDLAEGKEASDAVLRAVVSPTAFFTPDFPEARYASYRLSSASGEAVAWAYVEHGSPAAKALHLELNEGSFLMQKNSKIFFTLKVKGPARPGSNQYLITEMLHKGWVSP